MKTLIIYFSKTGKTASLAAQMAERLAADSYEIKEAIPYTAADLNWTVPSSRANQEQADESARPAYKGELPDLSQYEQVIIGHPTWWGRPPRILQTVMEDLDLSGKRVATFATSGGSTYSQAQEVMNQMLVDPVKGEVLSTSQEIEKWLQESELM